MPKPGYVKAEPSWLSKDAVAQLAESVAQQIPYSPGGDLEPILKKIGGNLVVKDFWDLEDTDSGSIEVHGPSQFDIFVSNLTSGLRDRFTIAHEIGHFVLHYLLPRKRGVAIERMYATRYGSGREEWEANWFAASFLMPRKEFEEGFKLFQSVDVVAANFGVSRKAAEVRAKALHLLS